MPGSLHVIDRSLSLLGAQTGQIAPTLSCDEVDLCQIER